MYPVMIHSTAVQAQPLNESQRNERSSGLPPNSSDQYDMVAAVPFFQLVVVRDDSFPSGSRTPHYRYIALKMLEIVVSIDSATIQILAADLIADLGVVTRDQTLCNESPERWMHDFSQLVLSPSHRLHCIDLHRAKLATSVSKMYLEQLTIHPISINFTFIHTNYPRQSDDNVLSVLSYVPSFASVDRFPVRISSFIVADALESNDSLVSRITSKALYDLQAHLGPLAGSLAVLGRPIGLMRNIGNGVQALFYEPYEGLMKSPQSFMVGIGKGATSLVGGVMTGALDSTAALVGSYSAGLSAIGTFISLDRHLIRQRNEVRKQAVEAARKGMFSAFLNAGGNVASGIASGVSGLVTRPVEEARVDGAMGFIRGVGIGLVGVAVKPVLGVTDGISSAAQAISYSVSDYRMPSVRRAPRILTRVTLEGSDRKTTTDNSSVVSIHNLVPVVVDKAVFLLSPLTSFPTRKTHKMYIIVPNEYTK